MKRLFLIVALAAAVHADEKAGRQVYVAGAGTASLAGGEPMPASLFPCANCHGADGRGNAEGGVVASNITWLELTKPYRASTPNGRRRPPYNEQTLRRAITEGVDSAGNPLHAAMPRYAMPPQALSDLVDYLKVLGREDVPGVTATSVRIGTIVPESEAGARMKDVLSAYFQDAGEIHGRRIALDAVTASTLERDPPFALAGGLIAGIDREVEAAVERAGIPLVLPVSRRGDASADNRQRFYLSPGIELQLRGLLQARKPSRLHVMTRDSELLEMARRAAAPMELIERIDDTTTVLLLDPDAKLAELPAGNYPLLLLGNLLPADFFNTAGSYGNRITVALTTTPGDLTAHGLAEYRAFAARHSIPATQVASQLSAYAAAKVLVHALKQCGRELTRDALRAALEGLYEFETGFTPPLTFGRGRRIAAPRVHLAAFDPQKGFVPIATIDTSD
jgi:mono/diheme cytochrome c family protein